ncbi:serine aminopeptidase domain-containing protein, partial [uncultured Megasphaera sp.]|uniref:serine aminopeptidase domain-containing protein n=1 Tax=uncultured Megasphaera sp. TaxID=165188 RepID=UPI0025D1C270
DQRAVLSYDLLDPFFQAAMFYHTHKTVSSLEPAQAVKRIKIPVLFLHGSDDALVPVQTSKSLYDNCRSPKKEIYIFADSPHAVGIQTDRSEYMHVVSRFLEKDVGDD